MTELTKYIGPDLDMPSMGYGVGLQEVRTFSFFLHRCNEDISCLNSRPLPLPNIIKIKIHSSCKIEDFIESHYWVCGLIKDTDRRLPYKLRCRKYQGQQGDVSQSVRGNYKTRFRGGQNLTAVERNALVYQVYPVSRITGEGRTEF